MTNAKFEDLERRVKKLKLIKYIKIISFFIIFILISYYAIDFKRENEIAQSKPIIVEKKVKIELKAKGPVPIVKKIEVEEVEKIIETKIKEEVKKSENIDTYDTLKLSPHVTFEQDEKPIEVILKKEIIKEVFIIKEVSKKNIINLHVKEVKSEEALTERFKVANDFESAFSLSKLYYDKQRYEKSIFWSKKASKIKPKEEGPWSIFAKSKFAQGKSKEAVDSLELYLDYFSSEKIEELLKNYRSKK